MQAEEIRKIAKAEIEEEDLRSAVDVMKVRIRNARKSWLPWRIRFVVLNVNKEK